MSDLRPMVKVGPTAAFAHQFRGRPSACVGCGRLSAPMTRIERETPCDGQRWEWTVTGREFNYGTLWRGYNESGVVVGETYGDALQELPLDGLDTDEEFTITMRPIHDDA